MCSSDQIRNVQHDEKAFRSAPRGKFKGRTPCAAHQNARLRLKSICTFFGTSIMMPYFLERNHRRIDLSFLAFKFYQEFLYWRTCFNKNSLIILNRNLYNNTWYKDGKDFPQLTGDFLRNRRRKCKLLTTVHDSWLCTSSENSLWLSKALQKFTKKSYDWIN